MSGDDEGTNSVHTRSKVGRSIDEYDLTGVGSELEDRWVGRGVESQSLRSLADWFNCRLLRAKLRSAGAGLIEGEAENLYRLLTADDVGAGARVDAEARLRDAGLDPEEVRNEFVSHQAVHTYLTDFRDASKGAGDTDRLETARQTVQRLRSRLVAVTENSIERLVTAETLHLGEYEVFVDVQVFCADCGTSRSLTEILSDGGCDCTTES